MEFPTTVMTGTTATARWPGRQTRMARGLWLAAAVVTVTVTTTACGGANGTTNGAGSAGSTGAAPAGSLAAAPDAAAPGTTASGAAAPSLSSTASTTPTPAAPAAPVSHEVTIPSATTLTVVLETPVGSETSRVEQPVRARLARAVTIDGTTVLPEDSAVTGVVTAVTRAGKVKGRAHVAVRFDTVVPSGAGSTPYRMTTAAIGRTAASTEKKDAVKIGAPAVGGAIIGGLLGGGKGAVAGAAVGGGAGAAVVMSTRGEEAVLASGSTLTVRLSEPLTVTVTP